MKTWGKEVGWDGVAVHEAIDNGRDYFSTIFVAAFTSLAEAALSLALPLAAATVGMAFPRAMDTVLRMSRGVFVGTGSGRIDDGREHRRESVMVDATERLRRYGIDRISSPVQFIGGNSHPATRKMK